MGWDQKKGGRRYYYRSVRTPDKPHPVKVYMGRGAAGHEAAAVVEQRRRDREEAKATIRDEGEATAEADRLAEELRGRAAALSELWLALCGLHHHKGEWRLRRVKKA
jgi:hypothetical protein